MTTCKLNDTFLWKVCITMIEHILDQAVRANESEQDRILQTLASTPNETLPAIIQIFSKNAKKMYWEPAMKVIRLIGYPHNAPVISLIIEHASDGNSLAHGEALLALSQIQPNVIIPYLLEIFLGKEQGNKLWAYRVEDICMMFWSVEPIYAIRCGPTIAYLLSRHDLPHQPDTLTLLEVLEKIGPDSANYALPPLVDLIEREERSDIVEKAQALIASFSPLSLEPYKRLVSTVNG